MAALYPNLYHNAGADLGFLERGFICIKVGGTSEPPDPLWIYYCNAVCYKGTALYIKSDCMCVLFSKYNQFAFLNVLDILLVKL